MAESNSDVYASMGVNSAVMTSESPEEHEQNMLELDVMARDGDDAILLNESDDPYAAGEDPFKDPEEDDGKIQVRVGNEEHPAGEEAMEEEAEDEFKPLGEAPAELAEISEQLGQHETGFQEMITQATERGLGVETVERIYEEYGSDDGISEESYKELEAAGYSRSFVNSYISGQEALVERYVNQMMDFAGGKERFAAIYTHLETSNKDAAVSLEKAMEGRDVSAVKAILNLAGESYNKKFGRPASRSVAQKATPVKPVAKQKEVFTNRSEMVKAMSDSRYRTDPSYRRMIEQKVIDSNF